MSQVTNIAFEHLKNRLHILNMPKRVLKFTLLVIKFHIGLGKISQNLP